MSRRAKGAPEFDVDDDDTGQWERVNGMWGKPAAHEPAPIVRTPRLRPLTAGQADAIRAMEQNTITFLNGPAGSGKTHLAVGKAVDMLEANEVKRLVFLRPAKEVGGVTQGFLPGELENKNLPFLRPLLDELYHFYDAKQVRRMIADDVLELGAVGFLRGRTYLNTGVILDEGQNAAYPELRVFLNRLGDGSKMFVTGDLSVDEDGVMKQCDLHPDDRGAMDEFSRRFAAIDGIARVDLERVDVVRHRLVKAMQEMGL